MGLAELFSTYGEKYLLAIFETLSMTAICFAIAMVLSLVVVPLVSAFTPAVPFDVKPPQQLGAIDREYLHELEEEEIIEAQAAAGTSSRKEAAIE
jgi:hypothetical protein